MKSIFLKLSVLVAVIFPAMSSAEYSVAEFQAHSFFDYVIVDSAEKVFSDELVQEDLYKVTYLVDGDCAAAPTPSGDACALVPYCEYVWVDTFKVNDKFAVTGTGVSCDQHIEEVLNPQLIDEL